ncbi:MAG: hypothetical protein GC165_05255 [Armatimonadetes bacterium]|nr:hypothetical protein [Armatimonadota bacterium]MBS1727755.1 hypothetical protein [Armatimonadota bacterium]
MKMAWKVGFAVAALGAVAAGVVLLAPHKNNGHPLPAYATKPLPRKELSEVKDAPKEFIAQNENSSDKEVQSLVTRARIMEGYEAAKKKDFGAAHAEFVEAAYKHKGTNAMDPDYGTLSDQAAYQAIVCVDAEGKKDEAEKEYRQFMEERKESPLITACFRRLERLHGKNLPEDEARLQAGIAAQEKRIRFETSVCGPKCIEKILPILGQPQKDYKELAKLCGTTDSGTTLEGLKKGCDAIGLEAVGVELNARDFCHLTKPFVWLQNDHYLAVLEIKEGRMRVYDSRYDNEVWRSLPAPDNADFRAMGLAFELPKADLVAEPTKPEKPLAGGKS